MESAVYDGVLSTFQYIKSIWSSDIMFVAFR